MDGLGPLEQSVLEMLLAGNHPVLAALRAQADQSRVDSREQTGVGFFCHFQVPPTAALSLTNSDFHIGDVIADIQGLKHGAGFVLFVRDGRLDVLEGYSFDEPWPAAADSFSLTYEQTPRIIDLPEFL